MLLPLLLFFTSRTHAPPHRPAPRRPGPPRTPTPIPTHMHSHSHSHPRRVKRIPSPIPDKAWYLRPWAIAAVGGLLPFGSIFIEMYFIFTSFWNYKVWWRRYSGRYSLWHRVPAVQYGGTRGGGMPCREAAAQRGHRPVLPAADLVAGALPPPACPILRQVYYVYGFFLLVFLILLIVTVRGPPASHLMPLLLLPPRQPNFAHPCLAPVPACLPIPSSPSLSLSPVPCLVGNTHPPTAPTTTTVGVRHHRGHLLPAQRRELPLALDRLQRRRLHV